MFNLTTDSAVFMATRNGRIVFILGRKGDDVTKHAAAAARAIEQIESDPGPNAPLEDSGVVQFAVGLPAIEEVQKQLRDRSSQP